MKDYNKELILEQYGEEALVKVEEYKKDTNANVLLIYAEYGEFDILGGLMTNHSNGVDGVLDFLEIDMDKYAEEQGWDNWNYGALELIHVD